MKFYQDRNGNVRLVCTCGERHNKITPKESVNQEFICDKCNRKFRLLFKQIVMLIDVKEEK